MRWGVVWLFGDGLANGLGFGLGWACHRSLESFPFTNIEHTVVQGLLGEVHQESLSCTCNKLHM